MGDPRSASAAGDRDLPQRPGLLRRSLPVVAVVLVLAGIVAWLVVPRLASMFDVVGIWQDYRHACVIVIRNGTDQPVADVVATFAQAEALPPWRIGDLAPGKSSERQGKPSGAVVLDYRWNGTLRTHRFHTKLWGGRVVVVIRGEDAKMESNEGGASGSVEDASRAPK
jgi:hypothetical protein